MRGHEVERGESVVVEKKGLELQELCVAGVLAREGGDGVVEGGKGAFRMNTLHATPPPAAPGITAWNNHQRTTQ